MVSVQSILLIIILMEVVVGTSVILFRHRQKSDQYRKLKDKWNMSFPQQTTTIVMVIVGTLVVGGILTNIQSREGLPGSAIEAGTVSSLKNCDEICFDEGFDFGQCKQECENKEYDYGFSGCQQSSVCCCQYSTSE